MARHLALVLPGAGDGPLGSALRVPIITLEALGATVREVEYPGWRPAPGDADDMRRFVDDAQRKIERIIEAEPWDRVTVVAKSLGTIVLALLDPAVFGDRPVRAVWITPIFERAEVRDAAADRGWPTLLIAGTGDAAHHPDNHANVVERTGATEILVDGADHMLEIRGDVHATIEALHRIAAAVQGFTDG